MAWWYIDCHFSAYVESSFWKHTQILQLHIHEILLSFFIELRDKGKSGWCIEAGEIQQVKSSSPGHEPCCSHILVGSSILLINYILPPQWAVCSERAAILHFLLLTFLIAQAHYWILNDIYRLNELMTEIKCDGGCKRPLRPTNTSLPLIPIAAQREGITQPRFYLPFLNPHFLHGPSYSPCCCLLCLSCPLSQSARDSQVWLNFSCGLLLTDTCLWCLIIG